jgi:uridine kinase
MSEFITVRFSDGNECKYDRGTTLLEISRQRQLKYKSTIVAARVNNVLTDLQEKLEVSAEVDFFDLCTDQGVKTHERSLTFVLIMAADRLFPGKRVIVEHSLGDGVYCELALGRPTTVDDVAELSQEMNRFIEMDLPIVRQTMPLGEAIMRFEACGYNEKVRLLRQLEQDTVSIYSCDRIMDYLYGPMMPQTGQVKFFELKFYFPGFILRFPDQTNPAVVPNFVDQPKLAGIFGEAERWGELLNCPTVAELNEKITDGTFADTLRVAEALHEKKVAAIADQIFAKRDRIQLILIAGPSSSGKTTFAQRLGIQLRVHGIWPVAISLDDYFLNREATPMTANGEYDFESIDALDLPLFNAQLEQLLKGQAIAPPHYNFKTGCREESGRFLKLEANQIVIIEGIHGLNPRLSKGVAREHKLLIYVSALTQLSIDSHNRIPTTVTRLVRRIVRDNQFRSHDALQTLRIWPLVRKGEEANIFPFQEEADVMFNSALIYELAVLRRYAEPLLERIMPDVPEYLDSRRLRRFLQHFRFAPDDQVPSTSILREFIGNSGFEL